MRSTSQPSLPILIANGFTFVCCVVLFAVAPTHADDRIDFNREIRPILSENCFYCHGQDGNKREAGLRLDVRDDAVEHGAINPDQLNESELLKRIFSDDADLVMPPPDSNRVLTNEQKELVRRWIAQGAEYDKHWAFVPPTKSALPSVSQPEWVRNPIDQFVLAKLEQLELTPSPEADKATLIKRLYADLIGLPPTPDEVRDFEQDESPNAYERLVDRLMKSDHYGERMALPWLDAARYADSNGFQQDGDTWQWMWRDWVVKSINENLTFDQFTMWQIAGDLLPNATLEQKIASGFNRNHMLNGEGGAIAEEQRFVILFDRIDTTATTFLGLTMSCAQCHDHKYDPITQRDYYGLMDAFNRVPESGVPQYFSSRIRVASPFVEVPSEEVTKKIAELDARATALDAQAHPFVKVAFTGWKLGLLADKNPDGKGLSDSLSSLLKKPETERSDADKAEIEKQLQAHFDQKVRNLLKSDIPQLAELESVRNEKANYVADQMPRPMIMSDAQKRDTHVLIRGEYLNKGDKVDFATPSFLPTMPPDLPKDRLGFAKWLVSEEQPLLSRVQVNRMWQHFFGIGFVKTTEDFGVQSEYPIHRDLLDWLAVEFRESGWDMKKLNRMIVTSSTYRQSSKLNESLLQRDPENRLYARASRMRMPSMVLRDWALAASGLLDQRVGGKPVYPYQPDDIWESLAITKERDFTYPKSSGSDLYRRSLYTFWRRTVGPANMFDSSNRQTCKVRMSMTSTPLHALTTLNDPTWVEAARALAEEVMTQNSSLASQLEAAYRAVLCRAPNERELAIWEASFAKQRAMFEAAPDSATQFLSIGNKPKTNSADPLSQAALSVVCLGILNLDESLSRE
ncbi:MAG: PSD1 and planctomycete cytochrome C domain-containing protein [Pirellula sp.]|jgi:hypothetical protein|nr:PSD1 and planctomycete cytochrome C domain-containing protein [Pirellula sp.]